MSADDAEYPAWTKKTVKPVNKLLSGTIPSTPQKFNSTSSLFIDSTISKPKNAELIHCMAVEVTKFVAQTSDASRQLKIVEIYDETKYPLTHERVDEDKLPTVDTVERFIKAIFKVGQLAPESLVMAMAYLIRLMKTGSMQSLGTFNWRRALLSCLILASKVWEDQAVWNIDFIELFPKTTSHDLGQLEKKLLSLLGFDVSLKASEYAKIYFDIRSNSTNSTSNNVFTDLKPLTQAAAEKLELRSHDFTVKHNKALHRSSGSVDDIGQAMRSPRSILN